MQPANGPLPGVNEFLEFAESLKVRCQNVGVHGIGKLERKIKAEMKFLNQLKLQCPSAQQSQLKSSNLSQLSSVVHATERLPSVTNVIKRFAMDDREEGVLVDVVSGGGHIWFKIIARKAEALHCLWAGRGQFGERDPIRQAVEYVECAKRHPHMFTTPQVHFAFYNQVTEPMADALTDMGITVWGTRVPVRAELQKMISQHMAHLDEDSDEDDSDISYEQLEENYSSDNGGSEFPNTNDNLSTDCALSVEYHSPKTVCDAVLSQHIHSSRDSMNHSTARFCVSESSESEVLRTTDCSSSNLASLSSPMSSCTSNDVARPATCEGQTESLPSDAHSDVHSDVKCKIDAPQNDNDYISEMPDVVYRSLVTSPPDFRLLKTSIVSFNNPVTSVVKVNLDVTCLITLVSALSHGGCNIEYKEKVIRRQAEEEKMDPVLPGLNTFLQGKELYACKSAASCFNDLVALMGGPSEKSRAQDLMSRVNVVEDTPSPRAEKLICGGKIKDRSKVIFGTGDTLEAITVTSNMGFVRAAHNQGVVFPAFLHSARALTEVKQPKDISQSSLNEPNDDTNNVYQNVNKQS